MNNVFVLSEQELINMLEKTYKNGAFSYDKWSGQRDTL